MAVILNITTAVPEYTVTQEELLNFYAGSLAALGMDSTLKKLTWCAEKTKIRTRYSCIPDFHGTKQELFKNGNYNPKVEDRTILYKAKILPLATAAIDKCFAQNDIKPKEITHIITVSCTGVFAPGLEFLVAEYYGMEQAEKLALNFLGCYAALKAIKQASYIAQADSSACILILCAELCSLHFNPSVADEDIVANLLFADGAAALILCGDDFRPVQHKTVLKIDAVDSVFIPDTSHLMTWNISSAAFRMYLNKHIVDAIKENIFPGVNRFLGDMASAPDYWAIHPGGVRIVEAVKESLDLTAANVSDSLSVLENYGNMSSPTILFILERMLTKIRGDWDGENKKIFACAFGPGINIEMICFSAINTFSEKTLQRVISYEL